MLKHRLFFTLLAGCFVLFSVSAFAQQPKKLKTIIVDAGHGGDDFGAIGQYEHSMRSNEKDVTLAISLKLVEELKKQLPEINVVPTRTADIYQSPIEKANIANENKGDLFICIHADSGPLKTGRRQTGTRTVTRYKVTYKGKGKKKKKISTPYKAVEPVYDYYKLPLERNGTSVWIFAAHKTSEKLKAIMSEEGQNEGEYQIEAGADSSINNFDFNTPEGRAIAQIYAKRYQEKSDRLATLVNEEIEKTDRPALGVNQRQKGIWVLQATNMPAILIETGFINNPEDEKFLNSESGQQQMAATIVASIIRYKTQIENTNHTSPASTNK
ncbi:MAG: N-acetylmuramoyl-L-alanine amidase [Bacteroidota bacterium]